MLPCTYICMYVTLSEAEVNSLHQVRILFTDMKYVSKSDNMDIVLYMCVSGSM